MATEQVTFGAIKLSQVQVYFEGAHIGRLERAVGHENQDFWGLSDKLVDRYDRGHDLANQRARQCEAVGLVVRDGLSAAAQEGEGYAEEEP